MSLSILIFLRKLFCTRLKLGGEWVFEFYNVAIGEFDWLLRENTRLLKGGINQNKAVLQLRHDTRQKWGRGALNRALRLLFLSV